MKTQLITYHELERIPEIESKTHIQQTSLRKWGKTVWEFLVRSLTEVPEPQVWQSRDRNGGTYWRIYDPLSGQRAYLGSEEEVIAWIEQNYYQRIHANNDSSNYFLR